MTGDSLGQAGFIAGIVLSRNGVSFRPEWWMPPLWFVSHGSRM